MTEHTSIHPDTQIGMVGIKVADLRRSLQFYTDVLGFTIVNRPMAPQCWGRRMRGR